ncbi:ATP-binding protein [Thermomonospora cellulosilytica]
MAPGLFWSRHAKVDTSCEFHGCGRIGVRGAVRRIADRVVPAAELGCVKWEAPIDDTARRWASLHLRQWGAEGLVGDTETVLTELVTNAVREEATRVIVLIEPYCGLTQIEVCVWDDAPGQPRLPEPGPDAQGGRGLFMVDALSSAWGHHPLALAPGCAGKSSGPVSMARRPHDYRRTRPHNPFPRGRAPHRAHHGAAVRVHPRSGQSATPRLCLCADRARPYKENDPRSMNVATERAAGARGAFDTGTLETRGGRTGAARPVGQRACREWDHWARCSSCSPGVPMRSSGARLRRFAVSDREADLPGAGGAPSRTPAPHSFRKRPHPG